MMNISVFLYSVAVALMTGPALVHTTGRCELCYCDNSMKCNLHCTHMHEAEFITSAEKVMNKESTVTSLTTQYVNFTTLPSHIEWFQNIENIVILFNFAHINDTFIKSLRKIRYIKIYGGNSGYNTYNGLYLNSSETNIELIFENNNIEKITSLCQGDYDSIWNLSLQHNKIRSFTTIEIGSSNCKSKLQRLDLRHNSLTSFNAVVFLDLPGLQSIDISYNQIAAFNNTILSFTNQTINVRELFLGNNNLTKLKKESFKLFNKLELLSLEHNSLSKLQKIFTSLVELKTFNLSYNKFYSLNPNVFSDLTNLKTLDIRGNWLLKFDLHQLQHSLNSLKHISLSENPWVCEKLNNLINYLSNQNITFDISDHNIKGVSCIRVKMIKQILSLDENTDSDTESDTDEKKIYELRLIIYNLVVIIVMIIVVMVIVISVLVYRRRLKRGCVIQEKRTGKSEMSPVEKEELHYDYVEVTRMNQSAEALYEEITELPLQSEEGLYEEAPEIPLQSEEGLYEAPPDIPLQSTKHDSICSENSLYGLNPVTEFK